MSKPMIHAASSARRFGGIAEDYLDIHEFMDSSKAAFGDNRHRGLLHSSFGTFIVEKVFGRVRTNSGGKEYSTRDIAEIHCFEDLGFVPSVSDYLCEMNMRPWMCGVRSDVAPSQKLSRKKPDGPAEAGIALTRERMEIQD